MPEEHPQEPSGLTPAGLALTPAGLARAPGAAEASPPPPPLASPSSRGWLVGLESRWSALNVEGRLRRTRLVVKVFLVHVRYTLGYLAFGFLVSAPIQLGTAHDLDAERFLKCLVLGTLFLVPFGALTPFTTVDWGRMRIPEFKNLEVSLAWIATCAAAAFFCFSWAAAGVAPESRVGWLCDVRVAWLNVGLMFFAWLRAKFHTLMFREFYTLKPEDDLVLSLPPTVTALTPTAATTADAVPPADAAR